ncbi:LPO_1073/Vpar_1526 family protein [uncultured Megasphaera sp.]|uniref:LPO_1073/Vpar_1526 family protein n=1 Tax=uncultured Megasphaera sp. TaxID=165188 RepID=UPI0025EFCB41|nr:LPO_1073/Vpar_1526 family protein [uncultured Megasphaera sp.]
MTNFLPYAIIAGIAIVFFVICYILYSSGEKSESSPQTEKQNGKTKTRTRYDGGPQPRKVQHRRPATVKHARQLPNVAVEEDTEPLPQVPKMTLGERREHPEETAFVTTKGEAVRHNGKIVYREASVPVRRGPNADSVDATQVLSRDEILEAMEKVDKEEAAAYKAREEEAKLARQRQEEKEREEQEQQLARHRERREQARRAAAVAEAEDDGNGRRQWSEDLSDTKDEKPPLADMAAVVSADLAEKTRAAADGAPIEAKAEPKVDVKVVPARPQEKATSANTAVPEADGVPEATQVLRSPDLKMPAKEGAVVSEGMKAVASQLEKTQRMEPIHIDAATTAKKSSPDETMVMPPVRAHKSQEKATPVVKPAQASWESGSSGLDLRTPPASSDLHRPSLWEQDSTVESPVVRQCVSHFLRQYGVVSPELQQQTEYITSAAFDQIGCKTDAERQQAMAPLIAQEALQNVQKAYAAHPDDYVATIALQAFYDIINGSPISTRHLVAIDALKVMPYLSQSHYQILAILLLFLYSRNSHNVDKDSFCQYIDKYIYPFLEGFPTERPYYQQLDYLHCTAFEVKETHFAEILSDSYPLLFRYRGFTEEELRKALKGMRLSDEFIVQSFNSPLVKLAMVDESMAKRFFRMTGLTDRNIQDHILRLAKKRPANFSGEEALDIMEDISPVLADLGDIWDSSLLRVSTLSLLGLYLAQGFVKEIIGEEFDLSRWFE